MRKNVATEVGASEKFADCLDEIAPRRQEPIPDGMNEAAEPSRKGS